MNRLILLGNGFDLAHGLKTSYNDFVKWYFKKCLCRVWGPQPFEDDLIYVKKEDFYFAQVYKNELDDYINSLYATGLIACENQSYMNKATSEYFENPFSIKIKSKLLRMLFSKCSYNSWVEVENDFYQMLKDILKFSSEKDSDLRNLNDSLTAIISELQEYLCEQLPTNLNNAYTDIFNSALQKEDIIFDVSDNEFPTSTMVLNFNYTSTVEEYFKQSIYNREPKVLDVNYIHGRLNRLDNPIIFGFGDELDDDYRTIELEKTKGFLKFIKSFWYFKTTNYHKLLRFIESDRYQVFIMGHSCGLSDRTMLNMLFEHTNCESVKIFYYERGDYNNYEELTHEISKHFKDKSRMRRVIVPKSRSIPMPQAKVSEA